jgi:ABC-type transport system involved in multi-copper enzyme maturation permease subunit
LVTNIAHAEPWFPLPYGAQIIGNILTDPYPDHVTNISGRFRGGLTTITSYSATVTEGLAIMAIYFAVTAVLGLVLFERKDFN